MKPLAVALSALLLFAAGCANEQAEALRAEIAKLREERVDASTVEKARREAEEAEAALATTLAERDDTTAKFAERQAEQERTRAAIDAEIARNARLRAEIGAVASDARELARRGEELDAQIAAVRERATWVRDQADVLARELRPGDAAWASKRRLDALAEFCERVAREYPDDPVATEAARQAIRADAPSAEQVRTAAERAARLRDRFTGVYELPSREVAARADAPSEDGTASDAPAEGTP